MNETQMIQIFDDHDIIVARLRVREMARAKGFSMMDQARISLAASSLANAMGLTHANRGRIVIDCLDNERGTGIRVVCAKTCPTSGDPSPMQLGDTRWMVDEFNVERLPSNGVRVTIVKWGGKKNSNDVYDGHVAGIRRTT
jgi:hypothetical protein